MMSGISGTPNQRQVCLAFFILFVHCSGKVPFFLFFSIIKKIIDFVCSQTYCSFSSISLVLSLNHFIIKLSVLLVLKFLVLLKQGPSLLPSFKDLLQCCTYYMVSINHPWLKTFYNVITFNKKGSRPLILCNVSSRVSNWNSVAHNCAELHVTVRNCAQLFLNCK